MNGNKIKKNSILVVIISLFLLSCNPAKNSFIKGNFNYSVMLFNKNLGISSKFFGDMKIIDSSQIKKNYIEKTIKGIPELKAKKVIAYFKTTSDPDYETIVFFDELKKSLDTIIKTELLLNDTKSNHIIVYKRSKANKIVYLFLKPKKIDNHDYLVDAKILIDNITFDNEKLNKTTYSDVFFGIKDWSNYLISRNLLKTKLLPQTPIQKWEQYQFLTTINSFISNNTEYDSLIAKSTTRFQPVIDSLQKISEFESKALVWEKLKKITKNEKVVMLNEIHWLTKHRLLAYQFLDVLKENHFNYLAIEALENKQDSVINRRGYPSKASGYYVREPYFAHFIRKARKMGFKVISYDDMESNDRELSQAMNLKKIIDQDPNAKIFVYAGIDHIVESNPSKKWMAEIFKELTQINPLTFSQDKIVGTTSQEIVLLPSSSLKNVERLNTNVDYFIVNNIKSLIKEVYMNIDFKEVVLENDNFKSKSLLIKVFNKNEYENIKATAIPILITSISPTKAKIKLELPVGNYFIKILSDKDENLFDDYYEVK